MGIAPSKAWADEVLNALQEEEIRTTKVAFNHEDDGVRQLGKVMLFLLRIEINRRRNKIESLKNIKEELDEISARVKDLDGEINQLWDRANDSPEKKA